MTLDLNGAMSRLGNDVSLFEEFIGFYQEDYPRLLNDLKRAVGSRDPEGVHHAAHGLKGLVVSIGAVEVASAAGNLERLGRTKNLVEAELALEKLETEIDRLNEELASFQKTATNKSGSKK
jgi:HPt (histidine-containing phosphotransfer) domain-containing protein